MSYVSEFSEEQARSEQHQQLIAQELRRHADLRRDCLRIFDRDYWRPLEAKDVYDWYMGFLFGMHSGMWHAARAEAAQLGNYAVIDDLQDSVTNECKFLLIRTLKREAYE